MAFHRRVPAHTFTPPPVPDLFSVTDMATPPPPPVQAKPEPAPAKANPPPPPPPPAKVHDHHKMAPMLAKLVALGQNIYIGGPAGSGKTTAAEKACEAAGRKLFVLTPVADKFEVTGYVQPHSGKLLETQVTQWATTEGAYLLIDEVDGGMPGPLLTLNSILAQGWFVIPGNGRVQVPAYNRVIATANTWGAGADSEYTGRNKLDASFINRFPARLMWDYDPDFEISLAMGRVGSWKPPEWKPLNLPVQEKWAKDMHTMRRNAKTHGIKVMITPRDILAHCARMSAGFTQQESLDCSFLATVKPDIRAKLMEGVRL